MPAGAGGTAEATCQRHQRSTSPSGASSAGSFHTALQPPFASAGSGAVAAGLPAGDVSSLAGGSEVTTLVKLLAERFEADRQERIEQREADRLQRQEDRAFHASTLAASQGPRLPPIPKLSSAKDWPNFNSIVESYLAEPQYSPAGDGSLVETADNAAASRNLDVALAGKLHGEAWSLFQNRGDTFLRKGFAKLA